MNILVACEESQRVTAAFRARGHNAFSCDILATSGDKPEWHIQGDVLPLLNGFCSFVTCDGVEHHLEAKWDMLIAFPPCTYLTAAGACRLYPKKGQLDEERYKKGLAAKEFFMAMLNADCDKICVENPLPMKIFELPKDRQHIEPWQFGEPYKKRTFLWLKNLPQLQPTDIITEGVVSWVNGGNLTKDKTKRRKTGLVRNPKERSKTFQGIANAMAEQWG